jgi:hypothetical protein
MLYMVIEKFKKGKTEEIYKRSEKKGRMLPDGLKYIDSWVSASLDTCFQLMLCDDERLFNAWFEKWSDLVEFEIIPVITSAEAASKILGPQ